MVGRVGRAEESVARAGQEVADVHHLRGSCELFDSHRVCGARLAVFGGAGAAVRAGHGRRAGGAHQQGRYHQPGAIRARASHGVRGGEAES